MRQGAVTVLGGFIVIGTVAALYFRPSTAGDDCPALMMTAEQIEADQSLTHEQSFAVQDAASTRSQCLLETFQRLGMTDSSGPSADVMRMVRMPFVGDDLQKVLVMQQDVWAAQEAMDRRVEVWMAAGRQPVEQEQER